MNCTALVILVPNGAQISIQCHSRFAPKIGSAVNSSNSLQVVCTVDSGPRGHGFDSNSSIIKFALRRQTQKKSGGLKNNLSYATLMAKNI